METIRHGLNGYTIPSYMEEILTHNYCPYFVRMTIVRDGDSYKFTYRPGKFTRLDCSGIDTYGKLMLLRSLISINDAAEGYLIPADRYLIEPELIYTSGKSLNTRDLKILFYPDVKGLRFHKKLMLFTDRISGSNRDERELLSQFRESVDSGGINKARLFLDKNILRIESRNLGKAG